MTSLSGPESGATQQVAIVTGGATVPLNRLDESSDVAALVVFLASDASRTITGQSINVDGGVIWD